MLALAQTLGVLLTAGNPIVICAPPAVARELKAALVAEGRDVVDASAIDRALFGKPDAPSDVAKGVFKVLPTLPPDVLADLKKGAAGCKRGCGSEVVEAVWQRYLDREHPDWVIEVREPARGRGGALSAEMAYYRPSDAIISVVSVGGANARELAVKAAKAGISGRRRLFASRPSSPVLPGEPLPPAPEIEQGTAQTLTGLKYKLPDWCALPELEVMPQGAPLAITTAGLWRATLALADRETIGGKKTCVISVTESEVEMHCGSSIAMLRLYRGVRFDDPELQAGIAEYFVVMELAAACSGPPGAMVP